MEIILLKLYKKLFYKSNIKSFIIKDVWNKLYFISYLK
jgi:hypothetical protein